MQLHNNRRHLLLSAVIVATFGVPLLMPDTARARPNIRDAFFVVYPNAVNSQLRILPSNSDHCGVCHYSFNGGGTRNPYGNRLAQVIGSYPNNNAGRQAAVQSIQNEDNDGDGYTTLVEVTDTTNFANTPTFPGLTASNVSNVTNVLISDLQNYLVPMTGSDTTPPEVTVIYPNGGEVLLGNAPVNVQWTATDAGGIARIDILLSLDDGATYTPLMIGISQTGNGGSQAVFVPNRPAALARIRVEATDNASNVGQDASNAAFSIQAPPGGIAPTTLRDFDMPGTQPFETTPLASPNDCSACHGGYNPAVEPSFNWQGSMMAHASRDLLFEACMAVANQDAPDSGDVCLRCHIPNAWLQGRSVPTSGLAALPGDMHGVSCDLCHRMVDPIANPMNPPEDTAILAALSNPPSDFGNGMFVVDPNLDRKRGPFSDTASPHGVLQSPFHREAAHCGTCHDVSNPAFERDENGNYVPNAFNTPPTSMSPYVLLPIERTYSEWFHSAYNSEQGVYAPQFGGNREYVASCQDCHMRAVTGKGCNLPEAPTRDDLPLHDMTGGSTWLLSLLPQMFPGQVNEAAIQAGVLRARYMLQNAATMALEQDDDQLIVTITNETGHKLPTGYPEGRRMWVNVRFFDAGDVLLKESGAYDPETAHLSHDAEAKIYETEPGLDELTAGLLGVEPGPSFHFVLNNKIYKDNRIPPRGFSNAEFDLFGGKPVGATYVDGQYWDDTVYDVPHGATRVEVRLYYQSTSKEFVTFLRDANTTNTKGQELYDLWESNNKCPPELMIAQSIELTPVVNSGDINADGVVDDVDVALFTAVLLGLDATPDYVERSDMNDDDLTDGRDVQLFVEAYLTP